MDAPIPYYPVNEFGPLMKGLVIGTAMAGAAGVLLAKNDESEDGSPAE